MRRASLLRSTPFRLALIAAMLFIAAFTIASFFAVRSIRQELAHKLDRSITDTYAVVAATYAPQDIEDLVNTVDAYVIADQDGDQIFLLTGPDGAKLAGNVPAEPVPAGWATVARPKFGLSRNEPYRVFTGEFDGYRLLVGMSEADMSEINEIALTSFASAAAIVIALALAGGALLAIRVQQRMQAIVATMSRVSEGELSARIPLSGNGDDIDILATQVNAALERLATLFESMRQVSVDIAHDLKTPLNRLKLVIEDAVKSQARGENIAPQLADAKAESDHINATFDALLRIAQIESGVRKSRFGPVNLAGVVTDICEIYADVADEEGKSLKIRIEEATVLGDRELLVQLFSNLVENAIRHTPAGTDIGIEITWGGGNVVASVADSGPGIPPDEREKVLRRLYRLEKSRTSPGSGLGLSLVKAIAELHGATLELGDNMPGLRVVLKFPAAQS
ncbi:HAMP domain-containing sensor histidine kinase [Mesorhizobium sp. BAC0120]|uniref:sensor histidine kinase n=1 Tax=Mesorhizobium sp. BAC0120 TaxID=3090670 RepID=UPI00298C2F27|nr:HAMP domain-containing sensor histidine kinase [Mesorhizobium sp. BAC0120]MDW6025486.1 HAMP domain-containing sensor histidine kinase [Mesorhizobium sp. BAC0120]